MTEIMKKNLEWIEMNIKPENRTRIAYIYGALEPFVAKAIDRKIINRCNEGFEDLYDASKPQGVLFRLLDPKYAKEPTDGYEIIIYDDETVTMKYKFSSEFVEEYTGNFQSVLNWLSAGCDVDYLRNYLDVVIHEE